MKWICRRMRRLKKLDEPCRRNLVVSLLVRWRLLVDDEVLPRLFWDFVVSSLREGGIRVVELLVRRWDCWWRDGVVRRRRCALRSASPWSRVVDRSWRIGRRRVRDKWLLRRRGRGHCTSVPMNQQCSRVEGRVKIGLTSKDEAFPSSTHWQAGTRSPSTNRKQPCARKRISDP